MSVQDGGSETTQNATIAAFTNVRVLQKCDPVLIQECAKITLDLNHETAIYCTQVVRIGGTNDSEDLREELKRIRSRGLELAHLIKLKLIPLLRNKSISSKDLKELERLYSMYSACLELMEIQLLKTLVLVKNFPLHCGSNILINTDLTEPHGLCKNETVTLESLDSVSNNSKGMLEREEVKFLERDVNDLHELLYSINQTVDFQPWTINEDNETTRIRQTGERSKSVGSSNSSESYVMEVDNNVDDFRRRRCICVVLLTFTAVVISAVIIGVVLGIIE